MNMGDLCVVGSKGLALYIEHKQKTYKPGDTVSGYVFRHVPVLVGEKDVHVTVHCAGFTRTKMFGWLDNTPEGYEELESTFELLDPADSLTTLHHGPLHITREIEGLAHDPLGDNIQKGSGGTWWPFTITIPSQASASSTIFRGKQPSSGTVAPQYVSLDGDKAPGTTHDLLPSLQMSGVGPPNYGTPGLSLLGSVRYVIRANLVSAYANNNPEASAEICVQPDPAAARVIKPEMQLSSHAVIIDSSRFWAKDIQISFQVSLPNAYALDDAAPLPLAISAMWPPGYQLRDKKTPPNPTIMVESFRITLQETRTFWASVQDELCCRQRFRPLASTARIPEQTTIPFGDKVKPLDFGRLFNVRLDAVVEMDQKTETVSRPPPSFATCNLKRSYRIMWELGVEVKGTSKTLTGENDVLLV